MGINRMAALILIYTALVLIPLLLLLRILLGHMGSQTMFWAETAVGALYFILIYMTGYWGFVWYPLRFILPALFVGAAVLSYLRAGVKLPLWIMELSAVKMSFLTAATAVLSVLLVRAKAAKTYRGVPVRLSFPLRNGTYCIFEGGDGRKSRLMNCHFAGAAYKTSGMNKSMRYAADIVKLRCGMSGRALLPETAEDYHIHGEDLYSPCDGVVLEVTDKFDNEMPFLGKHPCSIGNYIVIQKEWAVILMGHLQKGSIRVRTGDKVLEGQPLARVGSSGLAEFPHLHIQAMKVAEDSIWGGEGVPILFDFKYLVKNTLKIQKPEKERQWRYYTKSIISRSS